MVRCKRCGAENYAIDMWCSSCLQHLDWTPPLAAEVPAEATVPAAASPEPEPAPLTPAVASVGVAADMPTDGTAAAVPPEESEPAALTLSAASEVAAPVEKVSPAARVEAVSPAASAPLVPALSARPPEPTIVRSKTRRRAAVWLVPVAAAAVVAVLLALPVAGWFRAAGHQQVTPQLPLTAAISQATPEATPTPSPTVTPSPTPTPTPPADQPLPAQPPADQPVPIPAFQTAVGDPTRTVAGFYQAVAAHQFDAAASAWSAQMQANYPPGQFINHRFAYTQGMNLLAARVVANNGQVSTVYIDLVEVYAGTDRHWVGTWQLVRSSSGWLLNQPNLRAAA